MPGQLFDADRNELVMRIQPDETIYWKLHTKRPGLSDQLQQVELDLTYKRRFSDTNLPDAYERLLLDILRGDHNLFVRNDELVAAWDIFTPILHELEEKRVEPILYEFGSRGPQEADAMVRRFGFERSTNYVWRDAKL